MSRNVDLPPVSMSLYLVAALVPLIVGGIGGYWIGSARAPVSEDASPAAEVRQPDGSLVLARVADPTPPPAPHAIPAGSKELRRITATVKSSKEDCPPTTVTTSLIQEGQGLRAITSSPDGAVATGSDVVIRPLNLQPPPRPWAAGASYEPVRGLYGVWVERDFGRLRVGAEIQQRDDDSLAAWLRAGFTFGR